ncbi:MAG: hypothetical protein DMG97_00215 [Acidobacteria bacterium]|nr:MAG: hypothetical protein DMG98_16760 [Acidobacteriota bacterium]PYV74861.1 MAG: hypothetical protein DMG96_19020 [Acidobacteriota bacterium]PYV78101.1 MAG: hypothetical protein DMG97_00215 [Acidobacteriota bacterium]
MKFRSGLSAHVWSQNIGSRNSGGFACRPRVIDATGESNQYVAGYVQKIGLEKTTRAPGQFRCLQIHTNPFRWFSCTYKDQDCFPRAAKSFVLRLVED